MASTPLLPNKWHLRKVADSAAKACWICYKSTTSVLITPDNKDFFYICNGHLKDRGFCTPDGVEAAALKVKKEQDDLAREKTRVIAEFEERRKERKRKKAKGKKDDDDDDKDEKSKKKKNDEDEDDEEDKKDEESKRKKLEELDGKNENGDVKNGGDGDEVRVFELARSFYKQRIDRIRNAQQAKRDRERLQNPSTFPSVPSAPPGP